MVIGDEPLSLLSNLLAPHSLCDFRNNRRVRRRRLPSLHAQCSQTRLASAQSQQKCIQKFAYDFSPAATATSNRPTKAHRKFDGGEYCSLANVRLCRNAHSGVRRMSHCMSDYYSAERTSETNVPVLNYCSDHAEQSSLQILSNFSHSLEDFFAKFAKGTAGFSE